MKKLKRMVRWLGVVLIPVVVLTGLTFKPIPITIKPIKLSADTAYRKMKGGYRIAYDQVPTAQPPTKGPVIFRLGGPGGISRFP